MKFRNEVYDALKDVALLYLPALGTLYAALAGIWHIPAAQEVVGSIVAIDTFLGGVLKLSSAGYTVPVDGKLVVDTSDQQIDRFSLELDKHPQEFIDSGQKTVTMKIHKSAPPVPSRPIPMSRPD
jgi:hypothetical protein